MRSGGETGRSYVPDGLPLLHPNTATDVAGEAAEVPVASSDAVEVPELDQIPVAPRAAGPQDHAIASRHDGSAGRGRVIGSLVPAGPAENRVEPAAGERGGDSAELDRRPEKGPP